MKRFLKMWVWSLALAGVSLLMVTTVAPRGVSAQTTDPAAVVDALRIAIGHEVEAGLALVTDDAVVRIVLHRRTRLVGSGPGRSRYARTWSSF